MENEYASDARIFRALCDENRLRVLEMLRGGERCACVLLENLDIAQSSLSYHMKILCDSGLVSARQEGKWTYYSMNSDGRIRALERLDAITAPEDPSI